MAQAGSKAGGLNLRSFATPVTIGAFALLAVTGLLMFFHLDRGFNKAAHEWLSWALVGGAALHIVVNWNAFKLYLKRPLALGIIITFLVVLGLSFIGPKNGGSPVRAVMDGISEVPITTLATIAKTTPDDIAARLRTHDLAVTDPSKDTLLSLAGNNREKVHHAIEGIFGE